MPTKEWTSRGKYDIFQHIIREAGATSPPRTRKRAVHKLLAEAIANHTDATEATYLVYHTLEGLGGDILHFAKEHEDWQEISDSASRVRDSVEDNAHAKPNKKTSRARRLDLWRCTFVTAQHWGMTTVVYYGFVAEMDQERLHWLETLRTVVKTCRSWEVAQRRLNHILLSRYLSWEGKVPAKKATSIGNDRCPISSADLHRLKEWGTSSDPFGDMWAVDVSEPDYAKFADLGCEEDECGLFIPGPNFGPLHRRKETNKSGTSEDGGTEDGRDDRPINALIGLVQDSGSGSELDLSSHSRETDTEYRDGGKAGEPFPNKSKRHKAPDEQTNRRSGTVDASTQRLIGHASTKGGTSAALNVNVTAAMRHTQIESLLGGSVDSPMKRAIDSHELTTDAEHGATGRQAKLARLSGPPILRRSEPGPLSPGAGNSSVDGSGSGRSSLSSHRIASDVVKGPQTPSTDYTGYPINLARTAGTGLTSASRPASKASQQAPILMSTQQTMPSVEEFEKDWRRSCQRVQDNLERLGCQLSSDSKKHTDIAIGWLKSCSEYNGHPVGGAEDARQSFLKRPRSAELPEEHAMFAMYQMSSDDFMMLLDSGVVVDAPVLISGGFTDKHSIEGYASLIVEFFDKVDNQGYGDRSTQTVQSRVVTRMKEEASQLGGIKIADPPLNLLNLRDYAIADQPCFLRHPRYRLLRAITSRNFSDQAGKRNCMHTTDITECETFNLFASTLAFSGAHVDLLGGTYVRVLDGHKAWMIAINLDEKDWEEFAVQGSGWIPPPKKARAIMMKKDDLLLMPPGRSIIHAPLTLQPTLMSGGMVMDTLNVTATLEHITWACTKTNVTNEDIPFQLHEMINELQRMVDKDSSRFCGPSVDVETFKTGFKVAIDAVRALHCSCRREVKEKGTKRVECGKNCPCRIRASRCTTLCRGHEIKSNGLLDCSHD